MSYTISKMTNDEVSDVFNLEQELLGTSSIKSISETLESNTLSYYVLKLDNEIIGFFEVSIISPECELYDIAIKKDYQGKHLSNLLMDKLILICKENLCETIFLEVNSINYKAISLYEKYGFKSYLIRKNYYGENDAILMKLDL